MHSALPGERDRLVGRAALGAPRHPPENGAKHLCKAEANFVQTLYRFGARVANRYMAWRDGNGEYQGKRGGD